MIEVDTAFLVVKSTDGTFSAFTDIKTEITTKRTAGELDIKTGSQELVDAIQLRNIARIVASVVTETPQDDTSKVTQAVRQSLIDKGLL